MRGAFSPRKKETTMARSQTLTPVGSDRTASSLLAQSAWVPLMRGIAALLFGLVALFWPGIALPVLVILFGIYAFVDGLFALGLSFRMASRHDHWIALMLGGIVGISIGIFTFRAPGLTAVALVYAVGIWAFVTGCMQIVTAFQLRKQISGEWALGLGGVISVIFGWLLFAQPLAGVITLVWLVGLYGIFFGCLMIYAGIQLRRLAGDASSTDALYGNSLP